MRRTLLDIARELEAELEGSPDTVIRGISGIREAGPGQITFLADSRYSSLVSGCKAEAILVPLDFKQPAALRQSRSQVDRPLLRCDSGR